MQTIEKIFKLIKEAVHLSGKFDEYKIRLSDGRFEKDHLINIYKIRQGIATDNNNYKLAEQMHQLITGLENYSEILLKGVDVSRKNYFGIFYLSQNYNEIIGYLELEDDEK